MTTRRKMCQIRGISEAKMEKIKVCESENEKDPYFYPRENNLICRWISTFYSL